MNLLPHKTILIPIIALVLSGFHSQPGFSGRLSPETDSESRRRTKTLDKKKLNVDEVEILFFLSNTSVQSHSPEALAKRLHTIYSETFGKNLDEFCDFLESSHFVLFLRKHRRIRSYLNDIALRRSVHTMGCSNLRSSKGRPENPLYTLLISLFEEPPRQGLPSQSSGDESLDGNSSSDDPSLLSLYPLPTTVLRIQTSLKESIGNSYDFWNMKAKLRRHKKGISDTTRK